MATYKTQQQADLEILRISDDTPNSRPESKRYAWLADCSSDDRTEEDYSPTADSDLRSPGDSVMEARGDVETSTFAAKRSSSRDTRSEASELPGRTWKTIVLRSGPISGIFSMLLAVASIVIAFGILMGSRHAPVEEWKVQPSAYLAVCTAVANQAMRYAAFQGVMIAWWSRTLRGSTLRKLHTDWRAGMTFVGALTAGRHMGLLGLACILSTFVAIDGPLLQRASTVTSVPIKDHPVALNVSLAAEVPSSFTGYWSRGSSWNIWSSSKSNRTDPIGSDAFFNRIVPVDTHIMDAKVGAAYFADAPMTGFVRGCPARHTCKAKVQAPALAPVSCTTNATTVRYSAQLGFDDYESLPLQTYTFLVTLNLAIDQRESIDLITGFAQVDKKCAGTFKLTTCNLKSAIGEYDVTIADGTVILDPPGKPVIIALANNTRVLSAGLNESDWHPSTLAGIVTNGHYKWESSYQEWMGNDGHHKAEVYGAGISLQYILPGESTSECYSYSDPREDVLRSLNKLMFYTGIQAGAVSDPGRVDPGLPTHTTVTGHLHGHQNVYQSDMFWFLAAVAVEGICIALILPTYMGWWRLGRPVSFSPVEIAKAFEAPILSDCNSNSSGRDISKAIGDVFVQYGTVRADEKRPGTKLAFASPSFVERPVRDTQFEV